MQKLFNTSSRFSSKTILGFLIVLIGLAGATYVYKVNTANALIDFAIRYNTQFTATTPGSNVATGGQLKQPITVSSIGDSALDTIVQIDVVSSYGGNVAEQIFKKQDFSGGAKIFTLLWTPSKAGDYKIVVNVFDPKWNRYFISSDLGPIHVSQGNGSPVSFNDTTGGIADGSTATPQPVAPTTPSQPSTGGSGISNRLTFDGNPPRFKDGSINTSVLATMENDLGMTLYTYFPSPRTGTFPDDYSYIDSVLKTSPKPLMLGMSGFNHSSVRPYGHDYVSWANDAASKANLAGFVLDDFYVGGTDGIFANASYLQKLVNTAHAKNPSLKFYATMYCGTSGTQELKDLTTLTNSPDLLKNLTGVYLYTNPKFTLGTKSPENTINNCISLVRKTGKEVIEGVYIDDVADYASLSEANKETNVNIALKTSPDGYSIYFLPTSGSAIYSYVKTAFAASVAAPVTPTPITPTTPAGPTTAVGSIADAIKNGQCDKNYTVPGSSIIATRCNGIVYDTLGLGNPNQYLRLDVIIPNDSNPNKPMVAYVHGGALVCGFRTFDFGDYTDPSQQVRALAAKGFAVAAITYRLNNYAACGYPPYAQLPGSGEQVQTAPWPAQITDVKTAIQFLRKNATGLYNPNKIGAWGDSSGGFLVALLGTSGGNSEFEGRIGGSSQVQAVVDYFGPSALGLNRGGSGAYYDVVANNINVKAAPAPMVIAHGTCDGIVGIGSSDAIYNALKNAGSHVEYYKIPNGGHENITDAVSSACGGSTVSTNGGIANSYSGNILNFLNSYLK